MARAAWQGLLQPVRQRLERRAPPRSERPTAGEEAVHHPHAPWDVGTLLAVFAPPTPWQILSLNWTLGLTGTPFDVLPLRSRRAALDVLDLQMCLEGRAQHVTHKSQHKIRDQVVVDSGGLGVRFAPRLDVRGRWPSYHITYRQPEAHLRLDAEIEAWPQIHWWVDIPHLYRHYSAFATCRLDWSLGDASGYAETPALFEHGWGHHLLPLRVPLKIFRYEVLRLPAGGVAVSLWVDAPGGVSLASAAVRRLGPDAQPQRGTYACDVLAWETYENRAGEPRRLPQRWRGRQCFSDGADFVYEAERLTPPRAIMGDGFVHAFNWRGLGAAADQQAIGYVEQLGRP